MLDNFKYTFFLRAASAGLGATQIVAVVLFLDSQEQGFFYVMQSLIALQVLGSMGLNVALIHFLSNQISAIKFNEGRISGPEVPASEIFFALRYTFKWYCAASIAVLVVLSPLGIVFFESNSEKMVGLNGAWATICLSTAVNLLLIWLLTILDGFNKVELASKYRLCQLFVAYPLTWILLAFDFGLLSFGIGQLIGVIFTMFAILLLLKPLLIDFKVFWEKNRQTKWRAPFWNFQWRIALSWISGLFIYSVFSPLLLVYGGSIIAGQFGLGLHIFRSLAAISNSFMEVRQPLFGKLISEGKISELDKTYKKTLCITLVSFFAFGVFLLSMIWLISSYTDIFIERLPNISFLGVMFLVGVAYLIRMSQATYVRAHKEEPFLKVELCNALVTGLCAILLIPNVGLNGAVMSYFIGSFCVGLVLGTTVFTQFRKLQGYSDLI